MHPTTSANILQDIASGPTGNLSGRLPFHQCPHRADASPSFICYTPRHHLWALSSIPFNQSTIHSFIHSIISWFPSYYSAPFSLGSFHCHCRVLHLSAVLIRLSFSSLFSFSHFLRYTRFIWIYLTWRGQKYQQTEKKGNN
jgi:hypothetical protein